jgi:hypothetical protein
VNDTIFSHPSIKPENTDLFLLLFRPNGNRLRIVSSVSIVMIIVERKIFREQDHSITLYLDKIIRGIFREHSRYKT